VNPADTGSEQQNVIDGGAYVQDLIALPANFHVLAGVRLDRAITHESNLGPGSTVHDHPPVTPRLGLLWQARPELSFYATYTSNYGYTALGEVTKDTTLLPPESAQQYEFGIKTLLFRRLSTTTSIYQLTKENIATTDPTDPAFVIAIGQARSRGIEEDVAWLVTTGWQIIGGYSYIDAHVTKDNAGLQGLRFTGVPYNSGSLWTTYVVPTGPVSGLRFGGGVVARSDESDFVQEHIPGFGIGNAMLGYDSHLMQRTIRLQLNLNNVFNKTYFVALTPGAANPGVPRSVIASVKVLF
jgi:iron complex outermembrane receptor protein